MHHRRRPVLLLIALLLAASALVLGCGGGDSTSLTYDLNEGDVYTYDLAVTMNGSVTGPSISADQGTLPADTTFEARMELAVEDVTDGVTTISYRYLSASASAGGQDVPVPQGQLPEITVKIDEQGKVLSIEGLDKVMPPGFSGSSLPFDPSQLGAQSNVILPEGGLAKPGDEWSETTKVPIPGSDQVIEGTATGRLVSVESVDGRDIATVEYSVDVPIDLNLNLAEILAQTGLGALLESQGKKPEDLAITITMKGTEAADGTAKLDVETGMPVDFTSDVSVKMDIGITGAEGLLPKEAAGPMTMDLTAQVTMNEVK